MKNSPVIIFFFFFVAGISLFSSNKEMKGSSCDPRRPPVKSHIRYSTILNDLPQIQEFSIMPRDWSASETGIVIFKWKVAPGAAGTSIKQVTIRKKSGSGPNVEYSSMHPEGRYIVKILSPRTFPEGRTVYILTATNFRGIRSARTIEFNIKPDGGLEEKKLPQ